MSYRPVEMLRDCHKQPAHASAKTILCGMCRFAKMDTHPAIQAILLTPTESVNAVLKIIANLKPKESGKFLDYNGVPLPY